MFSCWTHTCHMPVLRAQKPKWSSALLCRLSQGNSWQRGELVIALHCFSTCLTIPSRLLRSSIYSKKSIFLKPVVDGGVFFFFFSSWVPHYISIFSITADWWSHGQCSCAIVCVEGEICFISSEFIIHLLKKKEKNVKGRLGIHIFFSHGLLMSLSLVTKQNKRAPKCHTLHYFFFSSLRICYCTYIQNPDQGW